MADAPIRGAGAARYSLMAIALHWLTALLLVVNATLGERMDGLSGLGKFESYQLHKSIGITVLALTVVRILWRIGHPPPPAPERRPCEQYLARAVHAAFYVLLVLLPLVGWAIVSTDSLQLETVLWGVLPWPHLPLPVSEPLNQTLTTTHGVLARLGYLCVALHVAGALKHQFLGTNPVLPRMLPFTRL